MSMAILKLNKLPEDEQVFTVNIDYTNIRSGARPGRVYAEKIISIS